MARLNAAAALAAGAARQSQGLLRLAARAFFRLAIACAAAQKRVSRHRDSACFCLRQQTGYAFSREKRLSAVWGDAFFGEARAAPARIKAQRLWRAAGAPPRASKAGHEN
jgi:hypothetical protein